MSLRKSIPNFDDAIVKIASGKKILEEYIKPLLASSTGYFKISSFFSPQVIKSIFQQLEECFKNKGRVKLVIGVHESEKLIPVLDRIRDKNRDVKFKLAVQNIVKEGIEQCLALTENPEDFLNILAELIRQDLIQIKLACVKIDFDEYLTTGKWPQNDATFHPKVSIFKDETETVVMSGSLNSTTKGFGDNVEEVSFTGSWTSPTLVKSYEEVFGEIWADRHADSHTVNFDDSIREIAASIIRGADKSETFSFKHISRLINDSPLFFHLSFPNVRLLPHQYSIYRAVLSRWPVTGLIADEVGLGKTIEAGAAISYLKKFFGARRTALLVPAALRNQWQREMYNLFGIKFYIYDSLNKSLFFESGKDPVHTIPNVEEDYFSYGVENIIFSWHYLRWRSNGQARLSSADEIDLILVDEAHGARLNGDQYAHRESTLLYQFLREYLGAVPHKLLLTATPFQTQHSDYLSLLRLLMSADEVEESSLRRMAKLNINGRLSPQQKVDAMKELTAEKPYVTKDVPPIADPTDLRELFQNYDDETYIKNHPTTIYTLRNTRDLLRTAGYKFPNVHLESYPIELNRVQKSIFDLVNNYIEKHLFSLESALGVQGIGFATALYQQRIVSSIKACYDTLSQRLKTLNKFISKKSLETDGVPFTGDDEDNENPLNPEITPLTESGITIAQAEAEHVREALIRIERKLINKDEITDPKIDKVLELIGRHVGNNESVIVFSRFTSTTNYIVQKIIEKGAYSVGRFQGDLKQYITSTETIDLSRQEISAMFTSRAFPVIICSDAASEGLNLQTASVIINVDVPWNPARLLQRFGRIDRFGQKRDDIYFYNLFYPETIEDSMYSRLHERNNDFREILGATPEITSESHIRSLQFREFLNRQDTTFSYKNSLMSLTRADNIRLHELILARLDVVDGVIDYFGKEFPFATNELEPNYLDFSHPIFSELRTHHSKNPQTLYELRNSAGVLFFYAVKQRNKIFPILNIEEILDYLISGNPIVRTPEHEHLLENNLVAGFTRILSTESYKLINHDFITFNGEESSFYSGLELIETAIRIDCMFREG